MKNLTDEMILNSINENNTTGIVVTIVVGLIFLFISGIILLIGKNKLSATKEGKNKKVNSYIIIGILLIILDIFIVCICIRSFSVEKNWYLEVVTVSDKYSIVETSSDKRAKTIYYIKLNLDNNNSSNINYVNDDEIKVTKEEFDSVDINDKIYIVIVNGNIYDDIWNLNEYTYSGDKI